MDVILSQVHASLTGIGALLSKQIKTKRRSAQTQSNQQRLNIVTFVFVSEIGLIFWLG